MLIKRNARAEIGRLFACMAYGEGIARECALRQAEIAGRAAMRRFLLRQARQEEHHARVFERVALCITPRGSGPVPPVLRRYRRELERACARTDLLETLVGQQIVLEGFGELVLDRMNRKLDQRWVGFGRLRRLLIHQEQGHRAFGGRAVQKMIERDPTGRERAGDAARRYLALTDGIVDELEPVFTVTGADPALYKRALRAGLPGWFGGSGR